MVTGDCHSPRASKSLAARRLRHQLVHAGYADGKLYVRDSIKKKGGNLICVVLSK